MSLSEKLKKIQKEIKKLEKKFAENKITESENLRLFTLLNERAALQAKVDLEKIVLQRTAIRDKIFSRYSTLLTGLSEEGRGGDLQLASHLVTMKEEGVAIILALDLLTFLMQFLLNTPYLIHKKQFMDAFQRQVDEQNNGNDIQLVYMPNEVGIYPDVYPLDGEGEIDYFQAPYPNGEAPYDAIIANGLMPRPVFEKGFEIALNMHMERMYGDILSVSQKRLMSNMTAAKSDKHKPDDALNALRDRKIMNSRRK